MSCLAAPPFVAPVLPGGLTLGAAIPSISLDPALCCKILPFPIATPPVPLPPLIFNPAVVAAINAALASMAAYVDQLQVNCPIE